MARYYDMNDVAAKLRTMQVHGGSKDGDDVLGIYCGDCNNLVCYNGEGSAFGNEMFEQFLAHDCEDLPEEPAVLETVELPEDNEPILSDEDYDYISPVQKLPLITHIPEAAWPAITDDLVAEIAGYLDATQAESQGPDEEAA